MKVEDLLRRDRSLEKTLKRMRENLVKGRKRKYRVSVAPMTFSVKLFFLTSNINNGIWCTTFQQTLSRGEYKRFTLNLSIFLNNSASRLIKQKQGL